MNGDEVIDRNMFNEYGNNGKTETTCATADGLAC